MEDQIMNTVMTVGIGVITFFLKRTMSQVDSQGTQLQQVQNDKAGRQELKESTEELKQEIKQIREDYTPKKVHEKEFDECRADIRQIRENYLTKDDFIRKGADPLKDNPKFEDWKRKYVQADGLSATVGGKNGVAEHEEKKLLERVDFQDRRLVQSKTEEYTEQIAGDAQKENAVCITREGNIYHCQGISDAVYPGYDLGDELTGAYVTHNHPISETHFSFSYDDISIFMDYKLPELTGVDEEYKYMIRRTEETIYAEHSILEHAYKGENYAEFMNKVMHGEADAETDEYDFYVRRLSEEYGFKYERKKR